MPASLNELKERITVLDLCCDGKNYAWKERIGHGKLWAKVEYPSQRNIFSSIGLSARSIKFTVRKRDDITLHNAILYQEKHCFLTDIKELDRAYMEILAALVEPRACTVERTGEPTLDELNRPVYGEPERITFPGYLVEKYISYKQNEPMVTQVKQYVLVVPKAVKLGVGEIVKIDDVPYVVAIAHELDEYKNEYEITTEGDV